MHRCMTPSKLDAIVQKAAAEKKAAEEYEDPDCLCKTYMTCLPITAICGKRKPEWVEVNRKRARICC